MPDRANLINGKIYTDERGTLRFINDFDFSDVRRFYNIIHPDVSVIRAWQGHKLEQKHFTVPFGSFLIAWVKIDDWVDPSQNLKAQHTILSASKPALLSIPPGYANGIKALTSHSILTVYSNLTLAESESDRWIFDKSLWFNWSAF